MEVALRTGGLSVLKFLEQGLENLFIAAFGRSDGERTPLLRVFEGDLQLLHGLADGSDCTRIGASDGNAQAMQQLRPSREHRKPRMSVSVRLWCLTLKHKPLNVCYCIYPVRLSYILNDLVAVIM